ncbi:long-chain-fatty-acid--CoA ligase [Mycolicibacterium sp.]|uniref:long-chain-fatty-acid--CoA ligase n=1 Tax=Mycolicibacterium sp. TaxID=2320850 RepID=UPI001A28389A|nr:long-chain-fatty-acid--CoA ligase [Mycolicibacterium sp.]MBJ7337540.1 long-chain-fatty-acid--CoA ligase [Mycolicibacterium sp.]
MWLYAEIKTLGDIPRHYARTTPGRMALLDAEGPTSFAELDARSNQIANVILQLHLSERPRVAFLAKNTTRYFEVLFGVNKAGAALLPLNWRLAAPEIEEILLDSTPEVLIVDREYVDLAIEVTSAAGLTLRIIEFDSAQRGSAELDSLVEAASELDPNVDVGPWQTAILMYTSGTTGKAKGAQLSHQGYLYLRLCEHLEPSFDYAADDLMLTVMPLFHAMAVGLSLQALYNGVPVAVYSMPAPAHLIELIARDRPTVVPLVPTVIQMLLDDEKASEADYSSVRLIIYAGESISPSLLRRALTEIGCEFLNFYGATETSAGVTFLLPEDHRLDDEARLQSCGRPLPLVEMRVADTEGNELPHGQVGEFLIRSPSLITAYFNQPETTASTFRDGWYHSGDCGYRDDEGFFYIVDRIKDMIVTGGSNVYSTEVEQAVLRLDGVSTCAVVGLPDDKWGERVVAVVVPKPDADLSEARIIAHCRGLIAGYKVPKQVEFVTALPLTASNKVLKRALREELLSKSI